MKKYFLYAVVLFLGLTSLSAPSVWGQETDYSSKYWTKAVSALDKDPEKDGRKVFEKTFAGQLTLWASDSTQIAAMKRGLNEVLDRLANSNNGPKAYTTAVDVIFEQLKEAAQSREKVVKINAILMIGELNSSQKRGEKVVPYAKARPFLKEMLKSKELPVQIVALRGLARHVQLGVRGEEKEELAKIFAQYAFVPPSKGEAIGTPESQWMRNISLEALGDLGSLGVKNEIGAKLLESVLLQSKELESPYFRRDMERRITAAVAFAKLPVSSDVLHEMKRKPEDLTQMMTKFFLQCMIYEYNHDFDLQEGLGGEGMADSGMNSRQNVMRTMTPEEETFQIRLWKQRTKAISNAFAWIFNDKNSCLRKMEDGNTAFLKIAKKVREISMMYDRAGLPEKKRATRSEDPENPEPVPVEVMGPSEDGRLSLYKMQNNLRKALTELAEEAGITVDIKKKQSSQNEMYY